MVKGFVMILNKLDNKIKYSEKAIRILSSRLVTNNDALDREGIQASLAMHKHYKKFLSGLKKSILK